MNLNRVVIDTNVFISALLNPVGIPRKVINIAFNQFTILQSEATYQELATRISKNKFDKYLEKDDKLDFLLSLKNRSLFVEFVHETTICSDSDDNKFLELALSGMAQYIITGDNDLLILNTYQRIPIITPAEFLDLFSVNWVFWGKIGKKTNPLNWINEGAFVVFFGSKLAYFCSFLLGGFRGL